MSVSSGLSRCPGWLRLTALALAAFAACLNPQPDDHPLNRDPQGTVANQGDTEVQAPPPASLHDDELQGPASTPPSSPSEPSGGSIADAGAPPPVAVDGGPGDLLENDAGPAD